MLLVLETLVFGTIISGRSIELVRYVVLCAQMVYFMRLSTSGLASLRSLALVEPWGQVECEKLKTSELPLRNFEHAVPGQKPRKCATLFSQATYFRFRPVGRPSAGARKVARAYLGDYSKAGY